MSLRLRPWALIDPMCILRLERGPGFGFPCGTFFFGAGVLTEVRSLCIFLGAMWRVSLFSWPSEVNMNRPFEGMSET